MIGERLREVRKNKNVSQDELAALLQARKSTVSAYENNKIDPVDKSKILIAKHFNISHDYLVGVIDDPVPYYTEKMIILPDQIQDKHREFITEYIRFVSREIHL